WPVRRSTPNCRRPRLGDLLQVGQGRLDTRLGHREKSLYVVVTERRDAVVLAEDRPRLLDFGAVARRAELVSPRGDTFIPATDDPAEGASGLGQDDLATALPGVSARHLVAAGEPRPDARCGTVGRLGPLVPPRRLADGAHLADPGDVGDETEDRLGRRGHRDRARYMELRVVDHRST